MRWPERRGRDPSGPRAAGTSPTKTAFPLPRLGFPRHSETRHARWPITEGSEEPEGTAEISNCAHSGHPQSHCTTEPRPLLTTFRTEPTLGNPEARVQLCQPRGPPPHSDSTTSPQNEKMWVARWGGVSSPQTLLRGEPGSRTQGHGWSPRAPPGPPRAVRPAGAQGRSPTIRG